MRGRGCMCSASAVGFGRAGAGSHVAPARAAVSSAPGYPQYRRRTSVWHAGVKGGRGKGAAHT